MNLLFFTQFAENQSSELCRELLFRTWDNHKSVGTNQQHEWEPQVLTNQRRTNMELGWLAPFSASVFKLKPSSNRIVHFYWLYFSFFLWMISRIISMMELVLLCVIFAVLCICVVLNNAPGAFFFSFYRLILFILIKKCRKWFCSRNFLTKNSDGDV